MLPPDVPQPSSVDRATQTEKIRALLTPSLPRSGIRIVSDIGQEGEYTLDPPNPAINRMTEEELIMWGVTNLHQDLAEYKGKKRDRLLEDVREAKRHEFRGGYNISSRSMDEVRKLIPPIDEYLAEEHEKIVILGNGFSELAVDVAKRFESGQLHDRPVVVDLFDYQKADLDLRDLATKFQKQKLPFPLSQKATQLREIVDQIEKGNITAVQYTIGEGNPPEVLKNAHLLINIFGPSESTLAEQLSLLGARGKLLSQYSFNDVSLDPRFSKRSILRNNGREGESSLIIRD